jgi:hypothetical protein
MSAVYGRLQGNRGEVTRTGSASSGVSTSAETWRSSVKTRMDADGTATVRLGEKGYANTLKLTVNADDLVAHRDHPAVAKAVLDVEAAAKALQETLDDLNVAAVEA